MTEKRARIAAQECAIANAQAILNKAIGANLRDQIVDRIYALMNSVVAYKKSDKWVRVILNAGCSQIFVRSIVDKITSDGFQCDCTTLGYMQNYPEPQRHAWCMSDDYNWAVFEDVKLYSAGCTDKESEEHGALPVISITNTWIPAKDEDVQCEDRDEIVEV